MSSKMKYCSVIFLVGICFSASQAAVLTPKEATHAGVEYFYGRCQTQQTLITSLIHAIETGDLHKAKAGYVDSRPPYEEIEVLAPAFGELDEAIDARPYVWGDGEDNEAFKGFHRIERDLYRDGNLYSALKHARQLNESVAELCKVLREKTGFSPHKSWEGLLGLSLEVPSKKVASEEETWSDLSLMIFRSNFKGIYETYKPFTKMSPGPSAKSVAEVEMIYKNIVEAMNVIDPMNMFQGINGGAARAYSDVVVSERAKIVHMSYKLLTALTKVHEEIVQHFPAEDMAEEEEEEDPEVVDSKLYSMHTLRGVKYFADQCKMQKTSAMELYKVLNSSDVTISVAKKAYTAARPPYEQIETLAGSFEDEDRYIDARPYAVDGGELSEDWQGFHLIERALYRDYDLKEALMAMPKLMDAIHSLCDKLEKPMETGTFSADTTWKGMIALAYEVGSKKIASEEETWSDLSLLIFRENIKGIWSQYYPFDKDVSAEASRKFKMAFGDLKSYMQKIDKGNEWGSGLNFRPYSSVSIAERKGISDKFYALARALVAAQSTLKAPSA